MSDKKKSYKYNNPPTDSFDEMMREWLLYPPSDLLAAFPRNSLDKRK
ncbi:MAG TPA: hypothetical protein VIY08_16560 [Candidatus Nitrosocosmicus sp.]